ncbi:MAG TPA: surface-adhesin E family protein [Alphaproteobacteria bacterium]|nr:surface-adhesin E family protein [Alphaproteobacteria bacterium]
MKYLGVLAVLVLAMPVPAVAAEFFAFGGGDKQSMALIEPARIQDIGNGHKVVPIDNVSADIGEYLDITTVEMDCTSSQWKVVSEILYTSLDPNSEPIDKTSVNEPGWQTFKEGSVFQEYFTFACHWPDVPNRSDAAEFPDIWAAANAAANAIYENQ